MQLLRLLPTTGNFAPWNLFNYLKKSTLNGPGHTIIQLLTSVLIWILRRPRVLLEFSFLPVLIKSAELLMRTKVWGGRGGRKKERKKKGGLKFHSLSIVSARKRGHSFYTVPLGLPSSDWRATGDADAFNVTGPRETPPDGRRAAAWNPKSDFASRSFCLCVRLLCFCSASWEGKHDLFTVSVPTTKWNHISHPSVG